MALSRGFIEQLGEGLLYGMKQNLQRKENTEAAKNELYKNLFMMKRQDEYNKQRLASEAADRIARQAIADARAQATDAYRIKQQENEALREKARIQREKNREKNAAQRFKISMNKGKKSDKTKALMNQLSLVEKDIYNSLASGGSLSHLPDLIILQNQIVDQLGEHGVQAKKMYFPDRTKDTQTPEPIVPDDNQFKVEDTWGILNAINPETEPTRVISPKNTRVNKLADPFGIRQ